MKMMPPDVISHQLQNLSEPSIFILDVSRTADHAGQIFIPHRLACRKRSYKTSGVTCNNCKDGPLTSSTVAIDANYILLASQQFRYSKYHSFQLQSYILHLDTPFYSETNAESIAVLHETIF